MFDQLKDYCKCIVPLTVRELQLIDKYFELRQLKKNELLLENGEVCDFIAFVASGSIRHFHIKDGDEKTCDLSFEKAWVTDFSSFNSGAPAKMNLQALGSTTVFSVNKINLARLYKDCPGYETFGRLMAEQVAQRATDIAMSLSSEKPEERFQNLMKEQPALLQRVPQKYIANFLGISPESLSRIRSRILRKQKS